MHAGRIAVATAVAKNYLPFARVLGDSLRRRHPDVPFLVLLTDEPEGLFDPAAEPFPVLRLEDLGIPGLDALARRRSCKQLAASSKAWLLGHVLDRGFDSAVFLDPDVLVVGDLSALFATVESAPVTLVPHLLRPPAGARAIDRELNILLSGVYNAGFVGVRDDGEARRFLRWWQQRVHAHCGHEVAAGLYYDQHWLSLAPCLFDGVAVVRDPGCNVAHWNLAERALSWEGDTLLVEGSPCRFFHFSGFDPDRPGSLTRYTRSADGARGEALDRLLRRYADLVRRAGWERTRDWPYAYDGALRSMAARAWRAVRRRGVRDAAWSSEGGGAGSGQ